MYWSPFEHSMTLKPSRSNTLACALPEITRMTSPVLLYCREHPPPDNGLSGRTGVKPRLPLFFPLAGCVSCGAPLRTAPASQQDMDEDPQLSPLILRKDAFLRHPATLRLVQPAIGIVVKHTFFIFSSFFFSFVSFSFFFFIFFFKGIQFNQSVQSW
ncbi:hypothetical protein EYF80_008587 [Liparis tanakae]|uniref:Uncharacterized protein n=1 Tax=Liparis tanakae TaxID=230148 RepID=A0A4Z2IVK5_9TELE|nr:hypothetical protein EYF80_008587 [Liparis tanakae]